MSKHGETNEIIYRRVTLNCLPFC